MEGLSGATETAVIVPVPAAEAVVGRYRRELDRSAVWGVPPHVTVLYPFVPPDQVTAEVIAALGAAVASASPFECEFARTEWFGDDVLWLAPEPAEPFRALTAAVWASFPRHPPYGGEFEDTIPHLSVGSTHRGDREGLRRAEAALRTELPFRTTVDRIRLIAGTDAASSWRTVAEWKSGHGEVQLFAEVE